MSSATLDELPVRELAEAATDDEDATAAAEAATPPGSPPPEPAAAEAASGAVSREQYDKRVSRAKESVQVKKLDLSGLAMDRELRKGDHQLTHTEENTLATPRARGEAILTLNGEALHKGETLFQLGPDALGTGELVFDWQPGGKALAVASFREGKALVQVLRRTGKKIHGYELADSMPRWIGWDCKGEVLAVRTQAHGVFLWDAGRLVAAVEAGEPLPANVVPLHLSPKHTVKATYCAWSKILPELALGTSDGKVIIYNGRDAVLQLHERKGTLHTPVTCGAWLPDNRLGLASGSRVKISKPIAAVGAKWESFSKFKLGGFGSKVPKHIQSAGAPEALAFTLGARAPFVAVSLGGKYLLTFDSARAHEDLGLTFPADYGSIAGFVWLEDNALLVCLSNGYIVSVDFARLVEMQAGGNLPQRVAAMATQRVFNEYVTSIERSSDGKVACCGDTTVKIVRNVGVDLEVIAEIALPRKATVGQFLDCIKWDSEGRGFACSSTDGYLYAFNVD